MYFSVQGKPSTHICIKKYITICFRELSVPNIIFIYWDNQACTMKGLCHDLNKKHKTIGKQTK